MPDRVVPSAPQACGLDAYPGLGALASGLELETPRLRLRQFLEQDVDALAAMYADAEIGRAHV